MLAFIWTKSTQASSQIVNNLLFRFIVFQMEVEFGPLPKVLIIISSISLISKWYWKKQGNLGKDIKNYYEPEGTIKERLTEINVWCYYNPAAGKYDDYLLNFLVCKCLAEEGCGKCSKKKLGNRFMWVNITVGKFKINIRWNFSNLEFVCVLNAF